MTNPQTLSRLQFEKAGTALLVIQHEQIIDANDSAARLFNCPLDDLIGQRLLDFSPETQPDGQNSAELLQEYKNLVADGHSPRFEWEFNRQSGQTLFTQVILSNLTFEGQDYLQAELTDISAFKIGRQLLADSEQRSLDLINFLPDATFAIDTNGTLIAWNRAMERATGIKAADVLGKGDYEYALPFYGQRRPVLVNLVLEPANEIVRNYYSYLEEEDEHSLVTEVFTPYFVRPGGAYVWAKASRLYNANGEVAGAIETVRDITDRKMLEQQIQESFDRREQQIQITTEIAQQIMAAPSLNELFDRAVNLVHSHFGYYGVQLYTLNDDVLNLEQSAGDTGRMIPAAHHTLPVTTPHSLVAKAAAGKLPVLVPDVLQESGGLSNPPLPKTRAELAVPILLRGQVLGVLVVQSDKTGGLSMEDQILLAGLCGQIASAMENTRLIAYHTRAEAELKAHVQELNTLQRMLRREGWQTYQITKTDNVQGFHFSDDRLKPIYADEFDPRPGSPAQSGNTSKLSSHPLVIAGDVIGSVDVLDNPEHPLTAKDRAFLAAITEQISEALERARLLEQAHKRATELETVAQVGTVASTVLKTDELLQTVVDLTKSRFELYHAHIYLLNATGDTLVLAAGAGKTGKTMVKQGWSIPLDRTDSIVAQAARTRTGVIFNNVQSAPEFLPNPLLPNTRSELAVPMLVGNRLLGVLDVQSDVVDYFTEDNLRIHSTLAAQVAVALQNASLYQETQTTLSEMESLYNASRRINEATDLQEIVAAVAEGGSVPVVDRILLVYFEYNAIEELESIVVAANWEAAGKSATSVGTRYPKHVFPVVNLLQRAEPLFVDDIQNDPRIDLTTLDTFYRLNIRSLAVLPLWAGRRQIGALLLESAEVHQYTERQMAPYISLASQVGVAVENRRLLEETQRALAEVEAVQRRYTVQAWQSYEKRDAAPGYQHVRQGVLPLNNELPPEVAQAIASKKTTVISSAGAPATHGSASSDAARASLIVPLKVRNEIIGVLGLQEADQDREWTPEEIALVEAVAEQMALAAENLRLLDETQRAAWRDQIVSESTTQLWSSAEIEDVMKTAVTQLADKLGASEVVIRLGTEEQLLDD
ncbi:MAG: GAF domain-containing protein [Chloroflexi bacterium]|nr:MAG: GAF domain-containing protein [Chloroflexota bacterium]